MSELLKFTPVGQQFQRSSDGRTFIDRLVDALEVADHQVPHSQAHDDDMDDVWDLVAEYRLGVAGTTDP